MPSVFRSFSHWHVFLVEAVEELVCFPECECAARIHQSGSKKRKTLIIGQIFENGGLARCQNWH